MGKTNLIRAKKENSVKIKLLKIFSTNFDA